MFDKHEERELKRMLRWFQNHDGRRRKGVAKPGTPDSILVRTPEDGIPAAEESGDDTLWGSAECEVLTGIITDETDSELPRKENAIAINETAVTIRVYNPFSSSVAGESLEVVDHIRGGPFVARKGGGVPTALCAQSGSNWSGGAITKLDNTNGTVYGPSSSLWTRDDDGFICNSSGWWALLYAPEIKMLNDATRVEVYMRQYTDETHYTSIGRVYASCGAEEEYFTRPAMPVLVELTSGDIIKFYGQITDTSGGAGTAYVLTGSMLTMLVG